MNKDCIRFCTIMKMGDKSRDLESFRSRAQQRERRKIRFADEAGGELCQIKLIESVMKTGARAAVQPSLLAA
uniref:Uncharacterized protein n=1 Tax=Kalanchoe fedtschenkoi TaxID=63787 RepID=A0A7N0V602_KALFE